MNAPITSLDLITLRASSMPTAWKCGGSVRKPRLAIDPINEAAETGTATHKILEGLATSGLIAWDRINDVCDELGGDSEEVRMLCGKAQRMWKDLRAYFPASLAEVEVSYDIPEIVVEGLKLTGHIDWISIGADIARMGDWKSGRKDANYAQQMKAYMALVLLNFPQLQSATATIAWLRDETIENYTMTQEQATAWLTELVARVVKWDGTYRPGDHCEWCKRNHECPAANAEMRRDLAIIAGVDIETFEHEGFAALDAMTTQDVIELRRKASLVANLAERVNKQIKAYVLDRGDVVGPKAKLTIETIPRRSIDPQLAWPVLEAAGFGDEDFSACIKMSVTSVGNVVAKRAGRGMAGKARQALFDKLEMAGALEVENTERLVEKRI